jgi:hypothetical protein
MASPPARIPTIIPQLWELREADSLSDTTTPSVGTVCLAPSFVEFSFYHKLEECENKVHFFFA